jgi:hypothetical protein
MPRHSVVVIGVTVASSRSGFTEPSLESMIVGSSWNGTPKPPAVVVPTDMARSASTAPTRRIASPSSGVSSNCAVSGRWIRFQKGRS